MNPARTLGPALVSGEWREVWVYLAGPIGGAALGALAYQLVRGEQPRVPALGDQSSEEVPDGERPVRLPA
jgi:hypothetical protein